MWYEHSLIGTKLHDARIRLVEANAEIARSQSDKSASKAAKRLRASVRSELAEIEKERSGNTLLLKRELERRTGLESRVSILGHVQRGGVPSPKDRLLATRLGSAAANFIAEGKSNIMVGIHGDVVRAVPL